MLIDLIIDYKFPKEKPIDISLSDYPKWFDRRHIGFLKKYATKNTKLIVELGSWVGYSTAWWHAVTPARIICVDTWGGSAEHTEFSQKTLDDLHDAFIIKQWNNRDRISPMQMNTVQGMLKIKEYGIGKDVDLVYIDASHQYEDVITDIEMAWEIFPNAVLVGDDYKWKNKTQNYRETVKEAVEYFCKKHDVNHVTNSNSRPYLWGILRS